MAEKPNLFIIGAMKCGTTSLHNYLDAHPAITMSEEKEPGYFVEEMTFHKGSRWYHSLFNQDKEYRYRGESSTHYTKLPIYKGVPVRIHRFNPDAKLIYIMRDPFERVISHYWHAVRDLHNGGERRALLQAVKEKQEYLAFSEYIMQLKPYLDLYGKEAIYTLTFEALRDDPLSEMYKIFSWLGVEPVDISEALTTPHNVKPDRITGVAGGGLLNRIQYSQTWEPISRLIPKPVKEWAKSIAYSEVDQSSIKWEIARLKTLVGDRQKRQIEALSNLLGRDFPEWPSANSPL
jgi:hypothetical protein